MRSIKTHELPAVIIVGCCCSAFVVSYTWKKFQYWKRRQELQGKIRRKQLERREQYDIFRKVYPFQPEQVWITELSLDELLEKLQSRELKAIQVLHAFIAKSLRVTDEFNCVTEFVPWAKSLADELDNLSSPKGPLHGLPIAIKDDHDVQDLDSTIGFAKNLFKPAAQNSVPVQILVDLGAVPFCKTNLPQALAAINSDNPIWGTTYNALKKSASPGGSSGGSGCIVAAGAAPVAVGSDLAGSLRIPAHFQGLCTLRSTNGRLSNRGMRGGVKQVINPINVVSGFITKDVRSQVTMYRAVTANNIQSKYDSTVVPLPFNELLLTSSKRLKIGYYTSLPIFPAFGDTPETVLRAKSALEKLNYELIEFSLPSSFDLSRTIFGLYWCDLGKNLLEQFEGEPVSASAAKVVEHARTPVWMRKLLALSFSNGLPIRSKRMGELLRLGIGYHELDGFIDGINHIKELREGILKKMEEEKIDLILGPVMPFPSIDEKMMSFFAFAVIYTFMWSVLDLTAGVVRFGKETGRLIDNSDTENDLFLQMIKKALPAAIGLPINVQVIGKPYQEELVLRVLSDLENCYKQQANGSMKTNRMNGNGAKFH